MPPEAFAEFVRRHDPSTIRALAESVLAEEQALSDEGDARRAGEAG